MRWRRYQEHFRYQRRKCASMRGGGDSNWKTPFDEGMCWRKGRRLVLKLKIITSWSRRRVLAYSPTMALEEV